MGFLPVAMAGYFDSRNDSRSCGICLGLIYLSEKGIMIKYYLSYAGSMAEYKSGF